MLIIISLSNQPFIEAIIERLTTPKAVINKIILTTALFDKMNFKVGLPRYYLPPFLA